MKLTFKKMYDSIKDMEIESLKEKLSMYGGKYTFGKISNSSDCPEIDVVHPDSGEIIDVFVLSVKIDKRNNISMKVVKADLNIDKALLISGNKNFLYNTLSFIAEEIPFPRVLWGRFGLNVGLTEEQAETVLSDNEEDWRKGCSILKDAIENGNAWVEGNSYIPENEITEYNKRFGTTHVEGDCDFEL